eukprot:TRINITY_DN3830_c0_g1_i1.p1 TRINITY_DN3830_c0_g1~~TRINITY_DN3830_c0_g1_i1.p1  ORF type:complete len:607 (+),score=119.09 TRINITY_DN3830_c0_g1_i1:46-1866(+)
MPRKAFSGKAKKAQLQAKKAKHQAKSSGNYEVLKKKKDYSKENSVFTGESRKDGRNRYALEFKKESQAELQASKELAMRAYTPCQDLTADTAQYFNPVAHDFPKRPVWDSSWSKEKLEMNEQRIFRNYVTKMLRVEAQTDKKRRDDFSEEHEYDSDVSEQENDESQASHENNTEDYELSYFELNLETWRQLWRVLEKSQVLLVILDVRYAAATFPPSLYQYIKEKGKELIVVLNKIDLISGELAAAWKNYFITRYPGTHIVFFTSFPSYNLVGGVKENRRGMKIRKKKTQFSIVKEASEEIWEICNKLFGKEVDLSTWKDKIAGAENVDTRIVQETYDHTKQASGDSKGELVIGTVGHPNVGKSSLINSLCGKKVVSVSKTPGHTKHFQTIYLTRNVQLCDCPGLVFPSKVPKALQVLMGSFPIAQLREPYSVVQFLAERLDLPRLLDINLPEDETEWTAFLICEQFAVKKGFVTARTSRPDTYRAANMILRFALDGRICLSFTPPSFKPEDWTNHPDTRLADEVTALKKDSERSSPPLGDIDSQGSDDEFDRDENLDDDSGDAGDEDNASDETGDSDSDDDSQKGGGRSGGPSLYKKNPFAALAR